MEDFEAHPLTPARWEDLVTVFGGGDGKGECGRCWCMWWRLPREAGVGTTLGAGGAAENKARLRAIVEAGPPPGLVGYAAGEPVGWVQVGPRAAVPEWNAPKRLTAPTDPADAADPSVWGISCFVVRSGRRRRGHGAALLEAAIAWARAQGARRLDACPVEASEAGGAKKAASALYHGVAAQFFERGFAEVARRKADRPVVSLDLHP
ncbi:MAG: GNAT family N-acetyltransferase [Pseudomonadota bacterium]